MGEKRSAEDAAEVAAFLARHYPFDTLDPSVRGDLARHTSVATMKAGETVFPLGAPVDRFRLLRTGEVDLLSAQGEPVQRLRSGDGFGGRAILHGVGSALRADVTRDAAFYEIDAGRFRRLAEAEPAIRVFYERTRRPARTGYGAGAGLLGVPLAQMMTRDPLSVAGTATVGEAARAMAARNVSCVLVVELEHGRLTGLLTTGDLTRRVVAAGLPFDTAVDAVMTANPTFLTSDDTGFDALLAMSERGIGHVPVAQDGRPVGILTRTDLMRAAQASSIHIIRDVMRARSPSGLAGIVAQVPRMVAQLVASSAAPHEIGRVVTGVTDALTRRLVDLAQETLGPPPVPFLWLACGSQGRREQTAATDQDNVIILHDRYDEARHGGYFAALATGVSDALHEAGYVHCPGDMMATNPRWRQPVTVWRDHFADWIARPSPTAQMLASVMFDLRPIAGQAELFDGLRTDTLRRARANSIFLAHMIANALTHRPPLGVFRGFALIRSGEHRGALDLKHSGVVPIVDLARVYALQGGIEVANTRERLLAARAEGVLSKTGADDLVDAYDLIGELRLEHQAAQIRDGRPPDNYMTPSDLSALQRNHLRGAFGVVRTLQSALGSRSAF